MAILAAVFFVNGGCPFVGKVEDHLEAAFPVMEVEVVYAAMKWVEAIVSYDSLHFLLGDGYKLSNEVKAADGMTGMYNGRVCFVADATFDLLYVFVWEVIWFVGIANLADIMKECYQDDRFIGDIGSEQFFNGKSIYCDTNSMQQQSFFDGQVKTIGGRSCKPRGLCFEEVTENCQGFLSDGHLIEKFFVFRVQVLDVELCVWGSFHVF